MPANLAALPANTAYDRSTASPTTARKDSKMIEMDTYDNSARRCAWLKKGGTVMTNWLMGCSVTNKQGVENQNVNNLGIMI